MDGSLLTPAAIILALAAVVSTLSVTLMRVWQSRVAAADAKAAASDALAAKAVTALLEEKDAQIEAEKANTVRALELANGWMARAYYLEDQRAYVAQRMFEAKAAARYGPQLPPDSSAPPTPKRSQSPRPGMYSSTQTTTSKTRP